MKITGEGNNYVETLTDTVRFEVINKAFRLSVVYPKYFLGIAELWHNSTVKVSKIVFLGDSTGKILGKWPSHFERPELWALSQLEAFWETLKEKGEQNEDKSS
jgi:hypothetical protein